MEFPLDVIRQEAAAWFAKRRDGMPSPDEEAAFEGWRRRSAAHAQAYAETERAWHRWGRLQDSAHMREAAAAVMASTRPRRAARGPWRPLLLAASLAVVFLFGVLAILPPAQEPSTDTAYATELGQRQVEQLDDGTRIVLNTRTKLRVRYGWERREIVLESGEAMFEVAHDAGRPFVVVAGDGSVTALGTQFQVRNEMGMAVVTLLEGRVEVAMPAARKELSPGQQARYGVDVAGISVRQVDPAALTGWTQGRLDFNGLPLEEAVAEANRYSAVKIRLGDPALAGLLVGGSFQAGDNAAISAAVASVFPVRVARSDEHEILLMPR